MPKAKSTIGGETCGVARYDVRFQADDMQYEFETDAVTGEILSFEKGNRWDYKQRRKPLFVFTGYYGQFFASYVIIYIHYDVPTECRHTAYIGVESDGKNNI